MPKGIIDDGNLESATDELAGHRGENKILQLASTAEPPNVSQRRLAGLTCLRARV